MKMTEDTFSRLISLHMVILATITEILKLSYSLRLIIIGAFPHLNPT